jgi:hypothetical protein
MNDLQEINLSHKMKINVINGMAVYICTILCYGSAGQSMQGMLFTIA